MTITGLLLLTSFSLITALLNHILHSGVITQYLFKLPISFAPGDAMFHYQFP